ncbi:acetoacetate decarboxylase family protein [Paraneptunicella aestuarii]|uniref:acetoacetate decarboxylase family protein n=1 Tax=Paraneptunicella aestuarii TaxID=2831148 RepID=UPI001E3B6834|nr:acetoacetate decarboxylase family protein [Paraneptunicella aestuarii]UAA39618.1 acetoacetate decarboxylase family protein [Paraneptunicella aestuarii]
MKLNTQLTEELVANEDKFNTPFFQRFKLRRANAPLQLNENIQKDYLFPTFYNNVTCAQAIFLCDYKAAQSLMPHPKMKPVRVPGGRSLVVFSSYIYRDVMHIAPYNEIAMTIPVQIDPTYSIPLLPMLIPGYPGFGYYVFNMPVTSLENRIRGNNIWGLPKVLHNIEIEQQSNQVRTTASDEEGNNYIQLDVPTDLKYAELQHFDVKTHLYSVLNNQLLKSKTCFTGEFLVQKNMSRLWKKSGNTPALQIGTGKFAEQLRALNIDPYPFQTRFCTNMQACFDLSDPDYQAGFSVASESTLGM